MQVAHEKRGKVVIVRPLEKRLDGFSAPDFKKQMEGFINEGPSSFVLDMSEIDFVDSSGLGAIISSLRMLGGKGDLVIAGGREKVISLFKLTRMDRVFHMFPNIEEALAAFPA